MQSAFRIRPPHEYILRTVHTYYFVTIEQICRLYYSPKSLTYVRELVKELVDAGYLARFHAPRDTQAGSTPSILFLAKKGMLWLGEQGVEVKDRARISEKQELERNYHFIWHTLAVNDVLMAAAQLPEVAPHIHLATMLHERELKLRRVPSGTLPVIPDGFLDFHVTKQKRRICIWLEVDRGTIEERPFRRKLRHLAQYINSDAYPADFGAQSALCAFVIAKGGETRLKRLLAWSRMERSILDNVDIVFTPLAQDEVEPNKLAPIDAKRLFLAPLWHSPFDDELVSLLS